MLHDAFLQLIHLNLLIDPDKRVGLLFRVPGTELRILRWYSCLEGAEPLMMIADERESSLRPLGCAGWEPLPWYVLMNAESLTWARSRLMEELRAHETDAELARSRRVAALQGIRSKECLRSSRIGIRLGRSSAAMVPAVRERRDELSQMGIRFIEFNGQLHPVALLLQGSTESIPVNGLDAASEAELAAWQEQIKQLDTRAPITRPATAESIV